MSQSGVRQRKGGTENTPVDDVQHDTSSMQGKSGFLSTCFKGMLFSVVLIISGIVMVDLLVTAPIEPEPFEIPPPPKLEGALAVNTILQRSQRLFENKLKGPESVVVDKGHIYTGTADGEIVHIHKGEMRTIARLGKPPCGGDENEPTCGRPLGMRLDKDGYLLVADAYLGLFKVNVVTGDVFKILDSQKSIDGARPMFLNDLDIDPDGVIYFSDSSSKWGRRHNRYLTMESKPLGRLLKYDPATEKVEVLASGLRFANGVQLSRDGSFILVVETSVSRIMKYNLKGAKAGQLEVFADNLPGLPDNVRRSASGGYWVGIAVSRHADKFNMGDFCANKPWLKAFFTKIFSQEMIIKMTGKPHGMIVELDKTGKIVRSLHDPEGKVIPAVSEVEDDQGVLYMGSYFAPYIGKLDLNQLKKGA